MALVRETGNHAYSGVLLVRPSQLDPMPLDWRLIGRLAVGTRVTITSVKWIKTDNAGGWVLAVGMVAKDESQFAGQRFTYYWGDEVLNRAPWEDQMVPAERNVGRQGRHYQP